MSVCSRAAGGGWARACAVRAHGYAQVFAADGYVVLHRPADARTAQALAHPPPAARLHTDICY